MSTMTDINHTGLNGNPTADGGTTTTPQEEKTFTQAELNKIVQDRLAKEKSKAEATLAQREQELAAREFQLTAQKTLADRGFSPTLMDALNTSSPEAFEKALNTITEIYGDPQKPHPTLQITSSTPGLPSGLLSRDPVRDAMGLHRKE